MAATPLLARLKSLVTELKRRKVYHVTVLYLVLAVGGLQVLDLLVPETALPAWSSAFFVGLSIVGLPLVVVFAWTFDITPQGVRRTSDAIPEDASPESSDVDETVVAVLPFDNLSGAPEADPFAVGLHDDLLTELSRVSALTVISRTSVRGYRDTTKTIREIARELGVGTVVEGGVQMAGNRIRLNVQLIDARTDVHRWAERYDRELTAENIFHLQSELAAKVLVALKTHLTTAEQARISETPTANLEAYRLFTMGRDIVIERTAEALTKGIQHLERAIDLDPDYALAWAWLGLGLVALLDYRHVEAEELLSRAKHACHRALELDPQLAEAHAFHGCLRSHLRDCPGALEAHTRALELRPGFAGAHQWTCWVELLMGHAAEALVAARKATRLDPLDPEARGNRAMAELAAGEVEAARQEAGHALQQFHAFDYARWVDGLALYSLGRREEGSAVLQQLTERWASAWPDTARALDHVASQEGSAARDILVRQRETAPFHEALVCAAQGDADAAFSAMDRAPPFSWDETLFVRFFPAEPMVMLRKDPRFRRVLTELNRSWGMEG
jgi:TolB-like protein